MPPAFNPTIFAGRTWGFQAQAGVPLEVDLLSESTGRHLNPGSAFAPAALTEYSFIFGNSSTSPAKDLFLSGSSLSKNAVIQFSAPDNETPAAITGPISTPESAEMIVHRGNQSLVDLQNRTASEILSQRKVRKEALRVIDETGSVLQELEQIKHFKKVLEAKIAEIEKARQGMVVSVKKMTVPEVANRMRRILDSRSSLELVIELSQRANSSAPDFKEQIKNLIGIALNSKDSESARLAVQEFSVQLRLLIPFGDEDRGEKSRLSDLVAKLESRIGNLTQKEIAELLMDEFDPEQKSLADIIEAENAIYGIFEKPLGEMLEQVIAEMNVREENPYHSLFLFAERFDALAVQMEQTLFEKIDASLLGLIARKNDIFASPVVLSPIVENVRRLRNEAQHNFRLANDIENKSKDDGFDRVHSVLKPALKELRQVQARLNLEATEFKQEATKAQRNKDQILAESSQHNEKVRRAQSKILEMGSVSEINNRVAPVLAEVTRLLEEVKRLGQQEEDRREEMKELKARARSLQEAPEIKSWLEAHRLIESAAMTEEEIAVAESRIGQGSIRSLEEEIRAAQEEVNALRSSARLLDQQAARFPNEQIESIIAHVVPLHEAAESKIIATFGLEGSLISNLVLQAASFDESGREFDAFRAELQSGANILYSGRRRQYYESLATAARLFQDSVAEDVESFAPQLKKMTTELKAAHELRQDRLRGMTLPAEQKGRGDFYGHEIPQDLTLPDRIPLFARINNEQDDAYRNSGELPRYFDIALGTAVMFPHKGEVLPTDEGVIIGFHGATTQKSSINSLALWVTTFPKKFVRENEKGHNERRLTVISVANPFHEFGPYDPRLLKMNNLMAWVEAIRARYEGYHLPVVLKGRSFGGNVVAEHRRHYDNCLYIPMSAYNPTVYCGWVDTQGLKSKGRKFNLNGQKALDVLDPQWSFHRAGQRTLGSPVMPMVGRKDDYLQNTPQEYPAEFLADHPEFKGVTPTDMGQYEFWKNYERPEIGGLSVELRLFPNGKHFLYNVDDETPDTVTAAFESFGAFLDAYVFNKPWES